MSYEEYAVLTHKLEKPDLEPEIVTLVELMNFGTEGLLRAVYKVLRDKSYCVSGEIIVRQ